MSFLNKIINPNFPKTAIGLDKNRVTVVGLRKQGRGFALKQAGTIEMPDGILRPGFAESNILNLEALAAHLSEATEAAGLRNNKKWSISLPSATARSGILTLDVKPASKAEAEEVLKWKAERNFGATTADMRVSYLPLSPDDNGKVRYLGTAVRYNVLDEYEDLFRAMGWHVGLILPRPVAETRWLTEAGKRADAMLISSQSDGFNAVLVHKGEPGVVRSIICTPDEREDEIYRLMMFYRDRVAKDHSGNVLGNLLLVGRDFNTKRVTEIGAETLGEAPVLLRPEEVGLEIPVGSINFEEVAAPAGLASLSWA
jgi:Tfp pilus assembly PilM family ATPase